MIIPGSYCFVIWGMRPEYLGRLCKVVRTHSDGGYLVQMDRTGEVFGAIERNLFCVLTPGKVSK